MMIFAFIVQSVILSGYLFWAPKVRNPENSYDCWLVRGLRGIFFIIICYFSFIFIDTSIKILFLGVYGYGNITLYLASCVLLLVLGVEIIIGVVWISPNIKSLSTFIVMLILFIYQFEIERVVFFEDYDVMIRPMLYASIFVIIFTLIYEIYRKLKPEGFEDKPFWSFEKQFKQVFNWKLNLILWGLISAEMILMIEGYSLLFWLSFFF